MIIMFSILFLVFVGMTSISQRKTLPKESGMEESTANNLKADPNPMPSRSKITCLKEKDTEICWKSNFSLNKL